MDEPVYIMCPIKAANLRDNLENERCQVQIKKINEVILKAMEAGEKYVNYYESVHKAVAQHIGYRGWVIVQNGYSRNEYLFQIKLPDKIL